MRFLFLCFRLGISHSLVRNIKRGFLFVCESGVEAIEKGKKKMAKMLVMIGVALWTMSSLWASVTISVTTKTMQKSGGGGTITVTATEAWTAAADADWITIKSGSSGDADGKVMFTVSENATADTRIGHINITGDNVYTITQYGYTGSISPTSATCGLDGASGTITVTVDAGVSWSAKPNVDWITVTPAEGRSVGTVTYTVAAYNGVVSRTGSITIAGQTFSITQTGVDVNIEPKRTKVGADADMIQVAVTALAATKWEVTTEASWISILDKEQGYGDYDVTLVVNANPSFVQRTGTVSIGTATLTVVQDGKETANLAIDPENATASASGAYANIAVYATPDAPWTAQSLTSWLTISQGQEGAGNGNIKYVISPNPTLSEREGKIKITPPYKEPDIDLYAGLACWIPVGSSQTGEPSRYFYGHSSDSSYMSFTGSSSVLKGTSFAAKEDNAFSASISFSVGGLGCVNRLMTLGGQSFYLDIENRLYFNEMPTTFVVEKADTYYTILIRQNANGTLAIYAGNFNKTLSLVLETECSSVLDFTKAVTTDFLTLAYTTLPSSGYLTSGYMKNFRFWTRALSDDEAENVDTMQNVMEDCAPEYAPAKSVWNYFPLDGNLYNVTSSSSTPTTFTGSYSSTPTVCDNRFGLPHRALSKGGVTLGTVYNFYSYSEPNVTFSMWIYLAALPTTGSVQLYSITQKNSIKLSVLSSGAIQIDSTTFDANLIQAGRWYMVTLVSTAGETLQVYLDDVEIGNISSSITLGYYNDWDYDKLYGTFGSTSCAIDDLVIFHQALTSAEVRELYEASRAKVIYHTVQQGVQTAKLSETNQVAAAEGVNSSVQLTLAQNVNWAAAANDDWIHITSDTEGAGSAEIAFTVDANPLVVSRTGTLTIAGLTLTIEQEGLAAEVTCAKTFFDSVESDMGSISVYTEGAGQWTAVSNDDWIQIDPDSASGNGAGDCWFFIDDYSVTTQSRTGSITIAGKTVYITQCGYKLSIEPAIAEVGSNAGAGEIGVAASIDQVWEVISECDWITIVNGRSGIGNGKVQYQFKDNTTGETRTGTILIGGQKYTLTQRSTLPLTTKKFGEGEVTGSGYYDQGTYVTLTATPKEGYVFSHWQGDAVGVSNEVTIAMDLARNVEAVFIPESAAEQLAAAKAAQGGFYTRDQIHNLEIGNLVLDVDSATGQARIGVQLQETSDLSNPDWQPVDVTSKDLDIGDDGTVGIKAKAKGKAKFFRVVAPH